MCAWSCWVVLVNEIVFHFIFYQSGAVMHSLTKITTTRKYSKHKTSFRLSRFVTIWNWVMFLGFGLTIWCWNLGYFPGFMSNLRYQLRFHAFFVAVFLLSFSFISLFYFPTVSDFLLSVRRRIALPAFVLDIKLKIWNPLKTFGRSILRRISRRWKQRRKVKIKRHWIKFLLR